MTRPLRSDNDISRGLMWEEVLDSNEDTSAGKMLSLLDAFGGEAIVGVTALSERAGLSKSTAHRLLRALIDRGYVERAGRQYCLSHHIFELGNRSAGSHSRWLRDISQPYLGELFAQTRQLVHLSLLSGTDVLYLDKVMGLDAPRCPTLVGGRRPAYATALGKAMLAFSGSDVLESNLRVRFRRLTPYTMVTAAQIQRCLVRVRSDGIATDHEESLPGVNCIAAPICDPRTGKAIAAISVCSTSSAVEQRYGQALLRVSEALSRQCVTALSSKSPPAPSA